MYHSVKKWYRPVNLLFTPSVIFNFLIVRYWGIRGCFACFLLPICVLPGVVSASVLFRFSFDSASKKLNRGLRPARCWKNGRRLVVPSQKAVCEATSRNWPRESLTALELKRDRILLRSWSPGAYPRLNTRIFHACF